MEKTQQVSPTTTTETPADPKQELHPEEPLSADAQVNPLAGVEIGTTPIKPRPEASRNFEVSYDPETQRTDSVESTLSTGGGGVVDPDFDSSEAPHLPNAELSSAEPVAEPFDDKRETEGLQAGDLIIDEDVEELALFEASTRDLDFVEEMDIEPTLTADQELVESIDHIPKKMAFKIGEVGEMVGVKQYVLRYWESEFEQLRPRKSKNNQRVYTRKDVETALMIKKLLYRDRFSIEGARAALRQLKSQVKEEKDWRGVAQNVDSAASKLRDLLDDIRALRESL